MQVVFLVFLFIIGACCGSYLCCQARRMRLKESANEDPSAKKSSAKKSSTKKSLGNRSICLHCGYQLKWYDNLPIISWLFLKGKCRKCGKKIGLLEILSELGLALAFLVLGTTVNVSMATALEWAIFVMTLLLTLTLGFLAIYDGAYGELPSLCLTISIICAIIVLILKEWTLLLVTPFSLENILAPVLSVLILGGLYLLLYLISRGKWVGNGDWILGTAIGLALFSPWLSLIALFLSNFLACIIMFPFVKGKHRQKIHFGPFLVIAFVIVTSFADFFISML